jgi:hypothetical protein
VFAASFLHFSILLKFGVPGLQQTQKETVKPLKSAEKKPLISAPFKTLVVNYFCQLTLIFKLNANQPVNITATKYGAQLTHPKH